MKKLSLPGLQSPGHRHQARKGIAGELPVWMWFDNLGSLEKTRIPEPFLPLIFQKILEHSGNNLPIYFPFGIKSVLKMLSMFR